MSQAVEALDRITGWKLVQAARTNIDSESDSLLESRFRLTTVGSYYFRKLVGTFSYLDAVVIDTPVIDQELKALIPQARSIRLRLDRAERFCSYLDSQWYELEESGAVFDWPTKASEAKMEINTIRSRVGGAYMRS